MREQRSGRGSLAQESTHTAGLEKFPGTERFGAGHMGDRYHGAEVVEVVEVTCHNVAAVAVQGNSKHTGSQLSSAD